MEQVSSSNGKIHRVAIVGAGVAGLAMATCLKQMKTSVREVVVFDPRDVKADQDVVGGVVLLSSGAVILEKLGCLDALKKHAQPIERIVVTDNGDTLMKLEAQEVAEWMPELLCDHKGEGSPMLFAARWSVLRKVLHEFSYRPSKHLEGLEEYELAGNEQDIRNVSVKYMNAYEFQHLRENEADGKVTLFFKGGKEEGNFDLVIGADGVNSTMRGFTQYPNESLLDAFPRLASFLPEMRGNQSTGFRITQCITAHKEPSVASKSASISAKSERKEQLVQESPTDRAHELHHWIGDGCHVMTMPLPSEHEHEPSSPHNVVVMIYREQKTGKGGEDLNPSWQCLKGESRECIKERLTNAGFNELHELQGILATTCEQNGLTIDIGIRDNAIPLRSWSSKSGRVILIGDCAHATSPFLEQGANQALQDAFCLAGLISKYNHDLPLDQHVQFRRLAKKRTLFTLFFSLFISLIAMIAKQFFDRMLLRHRRPTKLQRLAHEFEKTRKFNACVLTVLARAMGFIETMRTPIGVFLKCIFFRVLSITGLAAYLFFRPMKPVV